MIKTTLLLLCVGLLWSCQKKEYPTHTYQNPDSYLKTNEPAPISVVEPDLLASNEEGVVGAMDKLEVVEKEIRAGIEAGQNTFPAVETGFSPAVPRGKILDKKHRKATKNILRTYRQKAPEAQNRTIEKPGLSSLLLSAAGLVTAIVTIALPGPLWVFILAVLAGTAGLILGISTLSRIKKKRIPSAAKGSAIAGVVLGALTFLGGIAVLLAIAAVAAAFGS